MPDISFQSIQNPPSGVVTFLFTDIVGSTRLLQQLGDRYASVLAEHQRHIRAALQAHHGVELGTEGDAFFVVFQQASDALAAAIEAQRALLAHAWPEHAPLRVRMGLSTGQPAVTPNGYVGIDVTRAKRICDAGHGGQILMSPTTREAIAGEPIQVKDLGRHRLKGLVQPERVFQIAAPDLPAEFPPLIVPDAFDAHYEAVVKALSEGRIVPFLGAGVNLCGRPLEKKWAYGQSAYLPSERELAEHLARNFDYPPNAPQDLVRVSQYVSVVNGSGPLYEELHTLFDADYAPTALHQFFARLPATLRTKGYVRYPLIVTTNYDDVLERAFQAADEPYDLVTYIAEGEQRSKFLHWTPEGETRLIERPNEYRGLSLDQRAVILKIHGAVDRASALWDSFVITEDHYINYLTRTDISNLLPVTLAAKLRKSHFLFLGYSLRDWNLRVILHRIWGDQKLTYKSWSVQGKLEPMDQEFWRKREVEVINVPLEDYVAALDERVKEVFA